MQLPLEEDRFQLDRVLKDEPETGTVEYYFGWRTSVAQALRLLNPAAEFVLTDIGMWGDSSGWIDLEHAPSLRTVGEALDWLLSNPDHHSDLVNFSCRIAGEFELNSHDDTEVTLQGPSGSAVDEWARALFTSRGFNPAPILEVMKQNHGKLIAIQPPAEVLGMYETLAECKKAHPET